VPDAVRVGIVGIRFNETEQADAKGSERHSRYRPQQALLLREEAFQATTPHRLHTSPWIQYYVMIYIVPLENL